MTNGDHDEPGRQDHCRGVRQCAARGRADRRKVEPLPLSGSHGPDARRHPPADGDPHAGRSERAPADSFDAHSLRRPRESARFACSQSQGTHGRRLHHRRAEPARPLQIGGRVQAVLPGEPGRSQGRERNHRRLRHHRLAGEKRPQ